MALSRPAAALASPSGDQGPAYCPGGNLYDLNSTRIFVGGLLVPPTGAR